MPKLTIIEFNGKEHHLEAADGTPVMRIAVDSMVPGILADCGGSCSCATCHCYVDDAWMDRIPAASTDEMEILECVLEAQPGSRLSCQVRVTQDVDGLVVRLPKSQT